jgi:hypothetical protein
MHEGQSYKQPILLPRYSKVEVAPVRQDVFLQVVLVFG